MGSEVAYPLAGADQAIKGLCKVGWVCGRDSEQAWRVYACGG